MGLGVSAEILYARAVARVSSGVAVARAFALVFFLLLSAPPRTGLGVGSAQVQPPPPNNPVGINLTRWTDLPYLRATAELVNSNGGDWGYVTMLLLDEDRRDPLRIQRLFDQCAQLHLTPIIRVGTSFDVAQQLWKRPAPGDPYLWRVFFDQLRWPTTARYILVGNEPNLSREWGGVVDPAGYALYLARWPGVFAHDARYWIFNGALDASNDTLMPDRLDEFEFLEGMRAAVPDIFARLHGWASSPYHFYWGTELRYTYRAYESELAAIGRELPVIITEFHPQHVEDPIHVANWYDTAFAHWLADPRVLAATPMFWNPESERFWMYGVRRDGLLETTSPTYHRIRRLRKVTGSPEYQPPWQAVARPEDASSEWAPAEPSMAAERVPAPSP